MDLIIALDFKISIVLMHRARDQVEVYLLVLVVRVGSKIRRSVDWRCREVGLCFRISGLKYRGRGCWRPDDLSQCRHGTSKELARTGNVVMHAHLDLHIKGCTGECFQISVHRSSTCSFRTGHTVRNKPSCLLRRGAGVEHPAVGGVSHQVPPGLGGGIGAQILVLQGRPPPPE